MLRVPLSQARSGMTLALPVHHPQSTGVTLLKPGMILDDHAIRRLAELKIREVWIRYPGLELMSEYVSPAVHAAQAELAAGVAQVVDAICSGAHAKLDFSIYRAAIVGLLDRLNEYPRAAIYLSQIAHAGGHHARHAADVCMLSLLLGMKLQGYLLTQRPRLVGAAAKDVSHLGMGAMLHDVGMLKLEPEVLARWFRTRDESDADWREHIRIGHELVRDAVGPAAAAVVLHHHQKYDGSGHPRRPGRPGETLPVAGNEIHVFARIVAAADLFDRLRYPGGPDDPPVPPVRALNQLRTGPCRPWVDPMILKALLAVAPAYPPGSLVTLSDRGTAAVVGWNPENPCRPVIRRLDGPEQARPHAPRRGWHDSPPGEVLDLRRRPDLSIVAVDGHDVTADNFYPSRPFEFDFAMAERALFNRAAELLMN